MGQARRPTTTPLRALLGLLLLLACLVGRSTGSSTPEDSTSTTSEPKALISVRKHVGGKEAVGIEGKPLEIEYTVRNLGNATATSVTIRENVAGLSIVGGGNGTVTVRDVAPQSRVTAKLVVISETERIIPASRAEVVYTYVNAQGEEVVVEGHSSANAPIEVYTWINYRKQTNDYTREWTLYFLGMAIPVLVPMTVWLVLRQTAAQKKKKA